MKEYKIEVKPYMMKKSTPDFDFMAKWNEDNPMPLKVMYGVKLQETKGMVRMRLHGDIKTKITRCCMVCGRELKNPISQYFGVGPECGGHGYVHPFSSDDELKDAVAAYKAKLVSTVWEGWIIKSAIECIDDDYDYIKKLAEMPIEGSEATAKKSSDKIAVNVIKARIDKPVRGTDDFSVFLSFKYNEDVKETIKGLNTHFWNKETKEWEIEYCEFNTLKLRLPDYQFDISGEALIPEKIDMSKNFNPKTNPMAHQVEGILYGLDHNRWLLADDQGLGKTKQIIDLAVIRKNALGFKHCLIVCGVNSLKWNWLEEIKKHSDEDGWILGMYQKNRRTDNQTWGIGSNKDKLDDLMKLGNDPHLDSHYFIITNIETLRNEEIANKLNELCEKDIINMVAVDEIHRCKNLNTQQGKGLLQLKPTIRIGMTGTPLMNTPLDLYAILKWLGYEKYSYWSYKDYFCYTDVWGKVIGYKNIDQLRNQLGSIMLRRTKGEVLDLPEKIYVNEYVELTDEQRSLYNQVIEDAMYSDDIEEETEEETRECILATYLKLRQVSGGIGQFSTIKKNPKMDRLEQLVEEAVYSGTKVIVYSNWVEGLRPAIERLQKYNPVVITGETKDADRQAIVNKFQTDITVKVICGTIGAMGTGLTLTAATEVIFLDEPWTNATKEQACDRAHRIGTTSAVTIHTLLSHDTYDEDVHNIVMGKKSISEDIVERKDLAKLKI